MYKIFAKPFRSCKTKILSGKHPNTSFKHSMWGPEKLYFLTKMVYIYYMLSGTSEM